MSAATIAIIAAGSLMAAFLLYLLVIYICRRRYYRWANWTARWIVH